MTSIELFSVYQFFVNDEYECVIPRVPAISAMKAAADAAETVAARVGLVTRIVIVDAADQLVFEWKYAEGVTWPPRPNNGAVVKTNA